MGYFLAELLCFVSYWGGMAWVIWADGQRQRRLAAERGGVDFMDRRPWQYMALGLLCGPLPFIAYFGTTRRSASGWLFGIAASGAWSVLFVVLHALLVWLATA